MEHQKMMECIVDSPETLAQEIADAVSAIYESYGRACRRYTGYSPSSLEIADRREAERDAVHLPFYLLPLTPDEASATSRETSSIIAVTRDLSPHGIGFRCDVPISAGQFIAEFDSLKTEQIRLLLERRWHRRQSLHCYLAGARIVRVLASDEYV